MAAAARAALVLGRLLSRGGRVAKAGRKGAKLPPRLDRAAQALAKRTGMPKSRAAMLLVGGVEGYGVYKDFRGNVTGKKRKYSSSHIVRRSLKGMRPGYKRFRRYKPVKPPSKFIKLKADYPGEVNSVSGTAWFGVQHSGGFGEYLTSVATAVTRSICAKGNMHPDNFDDALYFTGGAETDAHNLELTFRGVNPDSGDIESTADNIAIPGSGATSFNALALAVAQKFFDQLKQGKSPHFATLQNTTKGTYVMRNMELSSAYVEAYSTIVVHLQNQTNAPTGATAEDIASRDNIHAQPLHGKMYTFKHAGAIVRPELDLDPSVFQDEIVTGGISKWEAPTGPFAHPQKASSLFLNGKGETSVSLQPGQAKKQVLVLKYKGRLDKLFDKLSMRNRSTGAPTSQRFRAWGATTWFCFERAIRHGTTTLDIAFNVERHHSVKCTIKPVHRPLTKYG